MTKLPGLVRFKFRCIAGVEFIDENGGGPGLRAEKAAAEKSVAKLRNKPTVS